MELNKDILVAFPPPPPWKKIVDDVTGEIIYVNEITGDSTDVHPLQAHIDKQHKEDNATDVEDDGESKLSTCREENIVTHRADFGDGGEDEFCGGEHMDFRCEWKEIGLMGNILSYGITLKYYLEDQHFELVFDGVDAVWKYSKLDGSYGPIDEYDLFIGSKITLFGRHLSITSTNSDICRLIDKKENKLKKKRAYLQEKIETIGAIPCVRRATEERIRNITRSTSKTGHGNLRQLRNECLKLSEQMGSLGLTHLIK